MSNTPKNDHDNRHKLAWDIIENETSFETLQELAAECLIDLYKQDNDCFFSAWEERFGDE
jgi:hypothetical protein